MSNAILYGIKWFVFIILYSGAIIGLEVMEGSKITTTLHMGLRDLGVSFIFIVGTFSAVAYFVTLLPLSILIRKFVRNRLLPIILYTILFSLSGKVIFHWLFGDDFSQAYELKIETALLIFGITGFIYSIIDYVLDIFDKKRTSV
ncbi:hypothetical protein I6N90_21630 [Paenibacillus sp. GSMTC-2017]|uniref:hypothetical protein n=1 Tax=Paenibacillus sp. GSMTC-2017 TaxID=2794350 RepID=UPI0018D697AA|nr:hypothetical protein [Paenibacillus sp. GSMTC-2017]MBH5320398.1 hypothetical protein [Paenibacillus sp. GSMTC-2017]